MCQRCDVHFYRQVKVMVKIIQNASDLFREQREIPSRKDAIKIHFFKQQRSAPIFEKMIEYVSFASKSTSTRPIFQNVNEV
jgi:hypothetical protein